MYNNTQIYNIGLECGMYDASSKLHRPFTLHSHDLSETQSLPGKTIFFQKKIDNLKYVACIVKEL